MSVAPLRGAEDDLVADGGLPVGDDGAESAAAPVAADLEAGGGAEVVGASDQPGAGLQGSGGGGRGEIEDGEAEIGIDREHAADDLIGAGGNWKRRVGRRSGRKRLAPATCEQKKHRQRQERAGGVGHRGDPERAEPGLVET